MSLLPIVDAGNTSATQSYFIKDITQNGINPVIATNAVGVLGIQPNPIGSVASVQPSLTSAGVLRLGSSATSFQNVVLTDGLTTVNTTLAMGPAGAPSAINAGDVNVAGDLSFVDAQANGYSISGYWSANVAVAGGGAVANPAGLTPGVYLVVYAANGAGNENAQPSGVLYWSGTSWVGNAVSFNFTAGAPNTAIGPVAGGATLNIGGAAIPGAGVVYFRKLMN